MLIPLSDSKAVCLCGLLQPWPVTRGRWGTNQLKGIRLPPICRLRPGQYINTHAELSTGKDMVHTGACEWQLVSLLNGLLGLAGT